MTTLTESPVIPPYSADLLIEILHDFRIARRPLRREFPQASYLFVRSQAWHQVYCDQAYVVAGFVRRGQDVPAERVAALQAVHARWMAAMDADDADRAARKQVAA